MQSDKAKFKKDFIKRLIKLSLNTIGLCKKLRTDRNLMVIADQLLKSTTSIGANVVEAQASSSKRDYTKFFEIALKSANETKYWLFIVREGSKLDKNEIQKYLDEVEEISKVIGSSVLTLKDKR